MSSHGCTGLDGDPLRLLDHVVGVPQRPGRDDAHVHAHHGARDQQGVADVVVGVAEVGERDVLVVLPGVLAELLEGKMEWRP